MPHRCADEKAKETNGDIATLFTGRVVWLDSDAAEPEGDRPIRVYAYGIGMALLEQRFVERIEYIESVCIGNGIKAAGDWKTYYVAKKDSARLAEAVKSWKTVVPTAGFLFGENDEH